MPNEWKERVCVCMCVCVCVCVCLLCITVNLWVEQGDPAQMVSG